MLFILSASSTYFLKTGEQAHQALLRQHLVMAPSTKKHLERAGLKKSDIVLDVGCGTGLVSNDIAAYVGQVVGADISPEQINFANHHSFENVSFVLADVLGKNFLTQLKDQQFDVVYARLLLIHVTEPRRALSSMFEALKSGGTILLQESITSHMHSEPETQAVRDYSGLVIKLGKKRGLNFCLGSDLETMCIEAGFIDIKAFSSEMVFEDGLTQIIERLEEWAPGAIALGFVNQDVITNLKAALIEANKIPDIKLYHSLQSHIIAKKQQTFLKS